MCESMLGLYRLSAEVEKRKLMFVHKILTMSHESITQKFFIRKYLLYISDTNDIKLGFIPDICSLLNKYNLQYLINDFVNKSCQVPSKYAWKCSVKKAIYTLETQLWRERLGLDSDFKYFRILHADIKPALVYQLSKEHSYLFMADKIAKLWSRAVNSVNENCRHCGERYEDNLSHIVSKCHITLAKRETLFNDICVLTGRDFVSSLRCLDETDFLLKLLGAKIGPYINNEVFVFVMKRFYKFIIDCNKYMT